MYTKERLERLRDLPRQIKELERQCERLRREIDSCRGTDTVTGSQTEYPYTQHAIKVSGITDLERYLYLQQRLTIRQDILKSSRGEQLKLEKFLAALEDDSLRHIMTLYYVECKSWQEIAFLTGVTDESTPRRKVKLFLDNPGNPGNPEFGGVQFKMS